MTDPLAKPPRYYAQEIAAMPKIEDRRAALEQVPVEYREMVKSLVKITFDRRQNK